MIMLVAWVVCLVASIVGLALKDIRLHGLTLAVSLVMLLLIVTRELPR